ncbi:MAG: nuclear transport factor 2 family protein [Pseudomonadota bacterium]
MPIRQEIRRRSLLALGTGLVTVPLGLALTPTNTMAKASDMFDGSPNKRLLERGMNALFRDFDAAAMRELFRADYIQHNPNVPTGLDAVIGLLPVLKEAGLGYTTHRVLEDGDLLLTHTTYHNAEVFGANRVVAFDLWRVQDGQIAEHWDVIIPEYAETASGRSQTDGPTEVVDRHKTAVNKAIVESFVRVVLMGGDTDKMENYISNGLYHQHNPVVKDGPEALKAVLGEIENNRLHRVIGEGNFVLTQAEGTWNGKPVAIYDLFRVADSKIVEHWDVIQEIPAEMAHANGMF